MRRACSASRQPAEMALLAAAMANNCCVEQVKPFLRQAIAGAQGTLDSPGGCPCAPVRAPSSMMTGMVRARVAKARSCQVGGRHATGACKQAWAIDREESG